jgi:thiosulfate/3-mercaptopyruvate sulfurtransferase
MSRAQTRVSTISHGVAEATSRRAASISVHDLRRRLGDHDLIIIDVRPLPAYNGWRLDGDARGGHIRGAVALPASWVTMIESAELLRLLHVNGATPDKDIVLYASRADDVSVVRAWLEAFGYETVRVLEGGWAAWAADESLPVEALPRYRNLVFPTWLKDLLDGGHPEAAPAGRYLLFHVNFGVPEEYEENHLPGALYLDTNLLESTHDWNRRSPAELDDAVRALGITRDTTIILYGRDTEGDANEKWPGRRAGQIAATRAALILHYAGVDDIRLLDGGYDAWVRSGFELETTQRTPTPVEAFGAPIPRQPDSIVDIEEAKAILADPAHAALVSVRTWREHIGQVSGYNYIGPAGRIAGDVWGNCGSDAYHMQHYRTVDNTMRPYPEIAANWEQAGITPDKLVAFYCGTGWRASETWFYAYLMGWDRIAVYDGGWFEWSSNPANNPMETGDPTDDAIAV